MPFPSNSIRCPLLRRPAVAALLALTSLAGAAHAQTGLQPPLAQTAPSHVWEFVVSPYTLHWSQDDAHRRVGMLGLERHDTRDNSLWGLSLFSNSFGQPSAFAYYGHEWNGVAGRESLYLKLAAGIMYGYKAPYEDKVPFNHNGWSPALIPAIGWRLTPQDAVQAAALGTAGVMFTYNRRF